MYVSMYVIWYEIGLEVPPNIKREKKKTIVVKSSLKQTLRGILNLIGFGCA